MSIKEVPLEETVGAAVLGVPALLLYFKRFFTHAAKEDVSKSSADAEREIIDELRMEVTRMVSVNKSLSDSVTAMQMEIIRLSDENTKLHVAMNEMTKQINTISND